MTLMPTPECEHSISSFTKRERVDVLHFLSEWKYLHRNSFHQFHLYSTCMIGMSHQEDVCCHGLRWNGGCRGAWKVFERKRDIVRASILGSNSTTSDNGFIDRAARAVLTSASALNMEKERHVANTHKNVAADARTARAAQNSLGRGAIGFWNTSVVYSAVVQRCLLLRNDYRVNTICKRSPMYRQTLT